MVTRIIAIMLAVVFSLPLIAVGQDKMQKEMKKDKKMEMKNDVKMEMKKSEKEMGMGPVKSISCDDACGFMMKSRDEKELTETTMKHVKLHHNMTATEKEVKEMMKEEKKDEMKKE